MTNTENNPWGLDCGVATWRAASARLDGAAIGALSMLGAWYASWLFSASHECKPSEMIHATFGAVEAVMLEPEIAACGANCDAARRRIARLIEQRWEALPCAAPVRVDLRGMVDISYSAPDLTPEKVKADLAVLRASRSMARAFMPLPDEMVVSMRSEAAKFFSG